MKTTKRIVQETVDEVDFDKRYRKIENFDDPIYADDSIWNHEGEETSDAKEKQERGSENTSRKQIPYTFRQDKGLTWDRGHHNLDIGGGKHNDGTEELFNREGVINLIFDPYNRESDFNNETLDKVEELGGADSITVNSCLNVIQGRKFIELVIRQAAVALKPEGKVIFKIHPGDTKKGERKSGDGIPRVTKDGYQQFKKARKYVPLIHKYFNDIWIDNSNDVIIASSPKINVMTDEVPWYPEKDGDPRYLKLRKESKQFKKKLIRITEGDVHDMISESVRMIISELNDIHNGRTSNDENCPYLDKVFGDGFTIREMLEYDDPNDRIDYARERLECLGNGKRRTSFLLNDNLVLKLTNSFGHTFQTQNEYNFSFNKSGDIDLLPRIIYQSQDFTWNIMERVYPITDELCKQILGVSLYNDGNGPSLQGFQFWAENINRRDNRKNNSQSVKNLYDYKKNVVDNSGYSEYYAELAKTNPWFKKLFKLENLQRSDLNYGSDLSPDGYLRTDNLGVAYRNGKPTVVISDGGFLSPWGDVRKLGRKAEKIRGRQ